MISKDCDFLAEAENGAKSLRDESFLVIKGMLVGKDESFKPVFRRSLSSSFIILFVNFESLL